MPSENAGHYRALAADCDARARNERMPEFQQHWQMLAKSYRHLAEQAERNARTDIVYEPPERPRAVQQQQQQSQPTKEDEQ